MYPVSNAFLEAKITAPELAERFEVSRRTINRDIEDLCKAGIPIRTAQGTCGGISIMDGYRMDRTILTSKDMQMILAGLRIMDSVSGSSYFGQLMEKIQTGSSEFISGRGLYADRSVFVVYDDEPATVALMHEFMEQQGYTLDITDQRLHHEIYLSDVRKAAPEKLKTMYEELPSPKKKK